MLEIEIPNLLSRVIAIMEWRDSSFGGFACLGRPCDGVRYG